MGAYGIPVPPNVAGQMPNMGQFAGGPQGQPGQAQAGGAPSPDGMPVQDDGTSFMQEALNAIAEILGKVAAIAAQTNPELGPAIKQMAEAGSLIQSQLQTGAQPNDGGVPSTKPESPKDVTAA